jgi:beta-glucosidase
MAGRTYRYFEGAPVYPFGYGLSYTRFDYGPLKVEPAAKGAGQGVRVTTTIRNAGARPGEEVAQLYLNFPEAPGAPRLALRGFQRIALKPGETREVTFALSPRDLSSVDLDGERRVSAGRYRVSVGSGQPDTGVASRSANFAVNTAVAVAK